MERHHVPRRGAPKKKDSGIPLELKRMLPIAFLLSAMMALTGYGNSTFLSEVRGLPEELIGWIYLAGSVTTFFFLAVMPKLTERLGNKRVLRLLGFFSVGILLLLSVLAHPILVVVLFMLHLIAIAGLRFALDTNVEHYTDPERESTERGLLLTALNVAWLVFPLLGALLLGYGMPHAYLYVLGAVCMLGFLGIVHVWVKPFTLSSHTHRPLVARFATFWKQQDIRRAYIAHLTLHFFYSIMVIYTPLYLSRHMGIPWEQLGFVFLIMLLPFSLLEIPLGRLADSRIGEKEILIIGLFVLGITTALISFVETPLWWIWAILLFGTRVGAAATEIMSDSYFYKKVAKENLDDTSIFKESAPLGYVFGTLTASIFLGVVGIPLQYLFIMIAIIILGIIPFVAPMHDTR